MNYSTNYVNHIQEYKKNTTTQPGQFLSINFKYTGMYGELFIECQEINKAV